MSFWSWLKPEQRETSESYAEQVAAALLDAASGSSDLSQSVAAVEIAAGLWSRGFASARVEPNPYGLLTPALLAWIGREVCLQGEAVGLLEVTDRGLMLYPAVVDEISGTADPATWRYKLDIPDPRQPVPLPARLAPWYISGMALHRAPLGLAWRRGRLRRYPRACCPTWKGD